MKVAVSTVLDVLDGEHVFVYFAPETRDGVVLFVNGGNGTRVAE